MQDIERESRLNANIVICFEVRATALNPRIHTEGFPLCQHRTFQKGTSTEELRLNTRVHNFSLYTTTSTQEGRHKPSTKQRKNTLNDHKDYKHSLGDLKGSQTKALTIQDPGG